MQVPFATTLAKASPPHRSSQLDPPHRCGSQIFTGAHRRSQYRRSQEICSQAQISDYLYLLVSGAARCCALRTDGRRQIVDLILPGDLFGLTHPGIAELVIEAVSDGTTVTRCPRLRVERMADADPQLAREVREAALDALARLQAQLLVLGRVTATEKVSAFLLELARRTPLDAKSNLTLPMSRYDIADYLAISVETVCRSLTDLKQRGVITFSGCRRIRLVDHAALEGVSQAATTTSAPPRHSGSAAI